MKTLVTWLLGAVCGLVLLAPLPTRATPVWTPTVTAQTYYIADSTKQPVFEMFARPNVVLEVPASNAAHGVYLQTDFAHVGLNYEQSRLLLYGQQGVTVEGGGPFTVPSGGIGPGTINADGGYLVGGVPGLTRVLIITGPETLTITGGLITGASP